MFIFYWAFLLLFDQPANPVSAVFSKWKEPDDMVWIKWTRGSHISESDAV